MKKFTQWKVNSIVGICCLRVLLAFSKAGTSLCWRPIWVWRTVRHSARHGNLTRMNIGTYNKSGTAASEWDRPVRLGVPNPIYVCADVFGPVLRDFVANLFPRFCTQSNKCKNPMITQVQSTQAANFSPLHLQRVVYQWRLFGECLSKNEQMAKLMRNQMFIQTCYLRKQSWKWEWRVQHPTQHPYSAPVASLHSLLLPEQYIKSPAGSTAQHQSLMGTSLCLQQ